MTAFDRPLARNATRIPGLILLDLTVHGDERGWFKENWQRAKMAELGLAHFNPVQQNNSFNDRVGTTRGIHAEPWDKLVSVASGRVFCAWVDLRQGPAFGTVVTAELDPSRAAFVPRGVGNAFQTLVPETGYTYLVNRHWSPESQYTHLNLADETVDVPWPIPLSQSVVSAADRAHPRLAELAPVSDRRTLVLGASGQVGRAVRSLLGEGPQFEYATRADLDLSGPAWHHARRWEEYETIINAAAFTDVDGAETPEGRARAWSVNAAAVSRLAQIAAEHGITLVHLSTDYVFDGAAAAPYREDSAVNPVSVYGQSKAAGDLSVGLVPRHYVLRTSWVIGDGANFVRTMRQLAERGIDPRVVTDQVGRLTFADDLAAAIVHLLATDAPSGTYNVTGAGPARTWADIARDVFRLTGHDPNRIEPVTTQTYLAGVNGPHAARPRNSMLDLTKVGAAGFVPRAADAALVDYLAPDAS